MATANVRKDNRKLSKLHNRACKFPGDEDLALCRSFYRNQSPEYFRDILSRDNGLMTRILKDPSGDPDSPINGRLSGLFFTASVDRGSRTGEPIPASPFGSCRLLVPVKDMLDTASNLYFTDFYCMFEGSYHYVTLVMTVPGSKADQFCAKSLLQLNIDKNPFLVKDKSGQLRVTTKERLLVEIFYTEDLDIRDYELKYGIPPAGKGSSTKGGLPKNRDCIMCNVQT